MNSSLSLSLSNPSASTVDNTLILEQMPWSEYVGKMSKSDLALGITSFIYPESESRFFSRCGAVGEGQFQTAFFVYRYDESLNYVLRSSSGKLGGKVIENIKYQQNVKCSLKNFVEFDYPSKGIVGEPEWVGSVYDSKGVEIAKPQYTVTNEGVYFSQDVYGSLRVKYSVTRHRYMFLMSKDSNVTEDKYFSVVYALYDGGIESEVVEVPYGFEETDGFCGNGNNLITTPDEPDGVPTVSASNRTVLIDYCTQEVVE